MTTKRQQLYISPSLGLEVTVCW